jgi:nucleoside 2-deoxyribosyltransferase
VELIVNLPSKDQLIYLASPYFSIDPAIRERRYHLACLAAGKMLAQGLKVYSPIVHNHPIASLVELPKDWAFWREVDLLMLSRCDCLCVLCLEGWDKSVGVRAELEFVSNLGRSIDYLQPEDWCK